MINFLKAYYENAIIEVTVYLDFSKELQELI